MDKLALLKGPNSGSLAALGFEATIFQALMDNLRHSTSTAQGLSFFFFLFGMYLVRKFKCSMTGYIAMAVEKLTLR